MRNLLKMMSVVLVAMGLVIGTPSAHAERKGGTEEQVAVLLQWYHTYFEEGKYKQAEQVSELAQMAPADPRIAAALKLAQHQQAETVSALNVEVQLERVLGKLDRMERELHSLEASRLRRARIRIAQEPPGSPDAFRPGVD